MSRPNKTPLTDEQRALAGDPKWVRYALYLAVPWGRKLPRLAEDIDCAALEGLVKAARLFDPDKASFETFIQWHVRGRIQDFLRDFCRPYGYRRPRDGGGSEPQTLPFDRVEPHPGGGFDRHWQPRSDEGPVGWESDDGVEELTKGLPVPNKRAIRLLYTRAGMTNKAAGREMGLCESRVSQLATQGLSMLREKFQTEEAAV